jgi:anthranilate/para-aminobenzoate synthase component II
VASVRITSAAAVISATVSPLQRKAIKNPAICAEVAYKDQNIEGVQFHPESILTEHGHDMLRNFLESK